MVHSKDKWIAALKKAVADTKAKPSSGIACAIASVRVIRDGMIDDIGQKDEQDKMLCETVKDSCNELIKSLIANRKELAGFASNASAAAKAAGFATEMDELADLDE